VYYVSLQYFLNAHEGHMDADDSLPAANVADASSPESVAAPLPLLDRSSFLAIARKPRTIKLIEIAGYGRIHIRALTTAERDQLEAKFVKTGKGGRQKIDTVDMRAKTIQMGACHADGSLMFTVNDIPEIGKIPAIINDEVYNGIIKLSRMDADALEDEEKNSGNGQRDGS
jgi:hypothetical protein